MKLLRYFDGAKIRPGLLDQAGTIRDLGEVIADIDAVHLGPATLDHLSGLDRTRLRAVRGSVRLAPPITGTRNFLAVGLNYRDHAAETGSSIPSEPVLFNKAPNCIVGAYDDIVLPLGATRLDWEVELAVIIGTRAHAISPGQALEYVAGYCICHDVSERRWQSDGTGQLVKGKSAPTFGPLGPWLVTRDEIADPQQLTLSLWVNGRRVQHSSTREMIFPVTSLVAYISRFMALDPGDVITTGTPAGVGLASGQYLAAGDMVELAVDGLGRQRQVVRT